MSGDYFLFLFIFFSLAVIGAKKSWDWFDKDGKVKKTAQDGLATKIGKWFF